MPSPPKPWERSAAGGAAPATTTTTAAAPAPATPLASAPSATPSVPARPATISTTAPMTTATTLDQNLASTSAVNPYASTGFGASPYSRFGSYSSPYSSYGTGYGGYGGYGSTYGSGMGGMYGGLGGGYGMGMPGMMPMDPNNPSLFQQVGASTGQTFALIQSIVQTFGGFAQMLDSTFMATQSSFFAMLGVAEQFAHLRGALSQVFGVFGLVAWLRSWWKGEKTNMSDEFKRFLQSPPPPQNGPNGSPAPKPSKKPLIFFLLAVFGLPYAMHRLIKHLSQNLPQQPGQGLPGQPQTIAPAPIDPSKLSFARASYAFATTDPVELALAKGEIVAVLSTQDPSTGAEGEWWHGRTRDGRQGWFPKAYVEVVKPKEALAEPAAAPGETPAFGVKASA